MNEETLGALKRIIEEVEQKRKMKCIIGDCIVNDMIGGNDIALVKEYIKDQTTGDKMFIPYSLIFKIMSMNKVIKIVGDFYEGKTNEFEQELLDCEKQELVDFIVAMQGRGCFGRGIVHD